MLQFIYSCFSVAIKYVLFLFYNLGSILVSVLQFRYILLMLQFWKFCFNLTILDLCFSAIM